MHDTGVQTSKVAFLETWQLEMVPTPQMSAALHSLNPLKPLNTRELTSRPLTQIKTCL